MNNEHETKKFFNKLLKDIEDPETELGAEIINIGKQKVVDSFKKVYHDPKLQHSLETIVLKSEDSKQRPIVAHIDTNEVIKDVDSKTLRVSVVCETNLEAQIIQANSGGTGIKVRQDMIDYLKNKTGAAIGENKEESNGGIKFTKYYFDPSNALVRMEKRFEKELKKRTK